MKIYFYIVLTVVMLPIFFACKPSQPVTSADKADSAEISDAKPVSMDLSPFRRVPEKKSNGTVENHIFTPAHTSTKNGESKKQHQAASPALSGHQNSLVEEKLNGSAQFNAGIQEAHGFRLLLFSGDNREEAEKVLKKAKSWIPHADVPMLVYEQPNYKIKAGNFVRKTEAYQLLTALQKEFPGILIVSDLIDLEKLRKKYKNK
jgi:hypothetical protein